MKKIIIKSVLPTPFWNLIRDFYHRILLKKYLIFGRPYRIGETTKIKKRRLKEGFFEKYCNGIGLDIGYGGDPVTPDCRKWDIEHGDAQFLKGLKDSTFDFVYSSHTLEHLVDPAIALKNWWRILKPNGYLILYLPHRDLYEKKMTLPSLYNYEHKHFFLPDRDEPPDTIGILPLIQQTISCFNIIYIKKCNQKFRVANPEWYSDHEVSIEAVIRKTK